MEPITKLFTETYKDGCVPAGNEGRILSYNPSPWPITSTLVQPWTLYTALDPFKTIRQPNKLSILQASEMKTTMILAALLPRRTFNHEIRQASSGSVAR